MSLVIAQYPPFSVSLPLSVLMCEFNQRQGYLVMQDFSKTGTCTLYECQGRNNIYIFNEDFFFKSSKYLWILN